MRLMTPPLPAASRPSNSTHQPVTGLGDPVLQLDQLALQPEQLAKVSVAATGALLQQFYHRLARRLQTGQDSSSSSSSSKTVEQVFLHAQEILRIELIHHISSTDQPFSIPHRI